MRKTVLLLCILLCLSACRSVDIENIKSSLDSVFSETDDTGTYRINNFMSYYSYYLPSDMSEEALDSDSIVLRYGNSKIIMNLNISGIINSRYYPNSHHGDEGFFDDEYLIYSSDGSYFGFEGESKSYTYRLYDYEGTYVLHLRTNDMNYYGTVAAEDIEAVTSHLLTIARNTSVDHDEIVSAFSNKDVIVYKKKQINLFDTSISNNGDIANLLIDDAIIGDGIYRDGQTDIEPEKTAEDVIPADGEEVSEDTDN